MKVRIGNTVVDSGDMPIVLMFADDKERLQVIERLTSMEPKQGPRLYAESPSGVDEDFIQASLKMAGHVG